MIIVTVEVLSLLNDVAERNSVEYFNVIQGYS